MKITNEGTKFVEQFVDLYNEISQSQIHWEIATLEALMLFCNKILNENYVSLIASLDKYEYTQHAQIQERLQKLQSDCKQINTVLDDLMRNEDVLIFMCFENQHALSQKTSNSSSFVSLSSQMNMQQKMRKQSKDHFLTNNIEDINLPYDLEHLTDLFETYKLQFNNLQVEFHELH